ncbi:MAG: MATE family efflux transporter [Ruminococcus sp.]
MAIRCTAAVGTNGEIVALLVSLSAGFAVGANVWIAHLIGSGEREKIPNAIHSAVLLSILLGLLLGIIGQWLAKPLLLLIHTPSDIQTAAIQYLKLYFAGIPFLFLYDFAAAILRANGDSKRPLAALLLAGVLNVFLNLFFVIVCHLSVIGVALATDLAAALLPIRNSGMDDARARLFHSSGSRNYVWNLCHSNSLDIHRICAHTNIK